MISFKTTLNVPPDALRQIRDKIIESTMKSLLLRDDVGTDLMTIVDQDLRQAFAGLVQGNSPLTEKDVSFSDQQVYNIAEFLKSGKKIYAIKAFRAASGKGLKDTKDFLDKFGLGEGASQLFISMFIKR